MTCSNPTAGLLMMPAHACPVITAALVVTVPETEPNPRLNNDHNVLARNPIKCPRGSEK
jgi:hypothetical protein